MEIQKKLKNNLLNQFEKKVQQQQAKIQRLKKTIRDANVAKEQAEQTKIRIDHRIQSIIDNIAANHWWKDKQGRYLGCSTAVAKLLGLNSPTDVIGKSDHELPWSATADYLTLHDNWVMEEGKTLKREETIATTTGENLVFMVVKAPLRDDDGRIIGTIGTSVDITEIKQIQQSLKQAKEKAEESDKLKTEFIKNMEHDIRTPFSGIVGMATHLLKLETDELKKEYLGDIVDCSRELLNYCNYVLDFSKIESGELPILEKKFSLLDLLNSIRQLEIPASKIKNIQLKTEYDEKIPPIMIGDKYRISRILINLASNAIKFTEFGEILIAIKLAKQISQREIIIQCIIKDTGVGIPEEKQQFIFEKFTRISPSNKGKYKGIGLGLRIVKQFVHEIEGEIDVQSQAEKGTEFICTIPLKLPLI